jgi:threonine dehydratase
MAEGLTFVAPYDDPYTIAGQGTVGAEILRQLDSAALDGLAAIFVAVGGGGLAAGVAAYVKALRPDVRVIGVEPTGANAMAASLAAGRRVGLSKVDAFADGVAVKSVGAETFRLCRAHLDGVLLVSGAAISAAIKDVFNETRCILEPAGAVAVAGAKAYCASAAAAGAPLTGASVVAITSGANMNFDTLRLVAELADVGGAVERTLASTLPERRGAFLAFVEAATGGTATNITELKYRGSGGGGGNGAAGDAHVLWSAAAATPDAAAALAPRLNAAGFPTTDLSAVDAAAVHLRHLVGGRGGGIEGERILVVDFPERPGALLAFLRAVSPRWNVSLFHYRAAGGPSTSALLGVQVPTEDGAAFAAATASLGAEFQFSPLEAEARDAFDMFLS